MAVEKLAMLFLDGIVLLPNMTVQIDIVNDSYAVDAIREAMKKNTNVFITEKIDRPGPTVIENIEPVGVVACVHSLSKGLAGGKVKITLRGISRGEILSVYDEDKYYTADVNVITNEKAKDEKEAAKERAMKLNLVEIFTRFAKTGAEINPTADLVKKTKSLSDTLDVLAGAINCPMEDKRAVLRAVDIEERFIIVSRIIEQETEISSIRANLNKQVKAKVEKNQKEYVLREQLKIVNKELGLDKNEDEIEEYRRSLSKLTASDEVKNRIEKEISKLERNSRDTSESNVQRNFVETLLEMPWDKVSKDNKDVNRAEKILNRDHYGLDKVKERVIEFLSVRALTEKGDSPIICLVGPPGTGKTSIAKSVAEALNKKYVRLSLGGVKDEAEIRGHRRTYVGAMPGRIANGLKTAGVKNPLMVLDEIDKAGSDHHGDTSAALLEVLDSEQNCKFRDHYIDIPLDLSEVMFIATANDRSSIPRPLLDRMEIIELSGYTENEKFHIAKEHLVKKQYRANGIKASALKISDDALMCIIEHYTKEAGVRGLERCIGRICRKAARIIVQEGKKSVRVTEKNIKEFLGIYKYHFDKANEKDEIGIVRGLAWTQVGGDTLQIEVNVMPGKGEIILTGQLGDVMKESAQIGISYLRSVAKTYKISADVFKKNDFHIHIPQGSVPKDGPSAGITMATAVLSAIINKPVKASVAMTGEITLRGRVLPIGGLKEKLLAAKVAGIKTVIVPKKNRPDVEEIDVEIKDGLDIVFVETMEEVIGRAIV